MEELKERGYIIFNKEIPQERVEYGRQQINDKVNYYRLKGFIDNDLMKRANLRLNSNLDYLKYRVSNNNNSSDAGIFHRDIHSYAGVPEIYTCLTYLDESIMEIIVGSHKKISIPLMEAITYLKKRKKIKMKPDDIIVASYVGRPQTQDEYNRNLFMLAEYYNAKIGFENDRGELIAYAKRHRKLHKLQEEFAMLDKRELRSRNVRRQYGMHMTEQRKRQGELYIRDWLVTPRHTDEDGNVTLNLHKI